MENWLVKLKLFVLKNMIYIDKTAIIINPCLIRKNVYIGAFSIIGPNVVINENNWIDSHVIIKGKCVIGKNNKFFKFSSIGDEPQSIFSRNSNSLVLIGNNNIFRENFTMHKSVFENNGKTVIKDNNYFMVNTHVAHDCLIENNSIFANNVSIAGHVHIGNFVNISGFVGIHQYSYIGDYSFVAGGSIIFKDVFPFTMVSGNPAKLKKLNIVGMKRHCFNKKDVIYLKKIYNLIFKSSLTIKEILFYLKNENFYCEKKDIILNFLNKSKRGIIR